MPRFEVILRSLMYSSGIVAADENLHCPKLARGSLGTLCMESPWNGGNLYWPSGASSLTTMTSPSSIYNPVVTAESIGLNREDVHILGIIRIESSEAAYI
jgi:hypothetical protein